MTKNELKDKLEKANYYAFLLLAFSLNFPQPIIKYTLGFWLITCLFSIDYKLKPVVKKVYYIPLLLISFLILGRVIVSVIHHDFTFLLTKLLDTQLSLLFLPALLIFQINRYFNLKQILLVYITGCFTTCILVVGYFYLYRYSILTGSVEGIPLGTNTHNLVEDIQIFQLFISPFFKHRAAMGVNISLSIAALIYLIKELRKITFWKIIGTLGILAVFAVIIYASGSRSGILSLILVLFSSAIYMFKRKKIIFIIFLLIGILIAGLSNLKTTRLIDKGMKDYHSDISKMDPRFQIWESCMEIIKVNPWLGVGYSQVKPVLFEKYKEKGMLLDLEAKHNSHNQFLQFALESGIWSSAIFAFILLPVYFKKKIYFLSFSFSAVFTIFSLFEDTFIIINGVTIFVFFMALLVLAQKQISEAVDI